MIQLEDVMARLMIIFTFLLIVFSGCGVDKAFVIHRQSDVAFSEYDAVDHEKASMIWPDEYILEVPFVMQAPFANWSEHNESCEEAGILLAHYYYLDQPLTKQQADWELKDMVQYQLNNYGGEYDIYAEQMAWLATDYYGKYEPRVIYGTIENIKSELLAGNPVIVPTTAAYLKTEKNDYPEMGYHVVVVVGYNQRGFLTHDVGTYTGEDFTYSYDVLQSAMADYDYEALVLK